MKADDVGDFAWKAPIDSQKHLAAFTAIAMVVGIAIEETFAGRTFLHVVVVLNDLHEPLCCRLYRCIRARQDDAEVIYSKQSHW